MKTLLILVDGMRPDAMIQSPAAQKTLPLTSHTLTAKTVMPSMTLPCHMSLFHSVTPGRHGITSNIYTPMARPVNGLFEILTHAGKSCAFFYDWEQLRDLASPGNLDYSYCVRLDRFADQADEMVTCEALKVIRADAPDFIFLYLGDQDHIGHHDGWMSPNYLQATERAWQRINRVLEQLPDNYDVIITADHGGHDQSHGTDLPEDMTIPMVFCGPDFPAGMDLPALSILDIAPTIASVMGVPPDREWTGTSLLSLLQKP